MRLRFQFLKFTRREKKKKKVKNREEKAIWHVIPKAKPKKTFYYQPETYVP